MNILLVEPDYYTKYPPLGLLKISTYHKNIGHNVEFVRGIKHTSTRPDKIYITSLFTYSWKPVHEAVAFYRTVYPRAVVCLGGIYATLMPENAKTSGADIVHEGILPEVEDLLPDYSLVPDWKASILFASRGCVRKCSFCAVPRLEPKMTVQKKLTQLVLKTHNKVILWDNNILGIPDWWNIIQELKALKLEVDFNQGLDARLLSEEVIQSLKEIKINPIRLAYDNTGMRDYLEKAILFLEKNGFRKRRVIVYVLYNYTESPEAFLDKIRDLLEWGVVAYPMRFEPLDTLEKNQYVSPLWTRDYLDMVNKARRVIGYGGAFPPYDGLRKKFAAAKNFEDAFKLRPISEKASKRGRAVDAAWWSNEIDAIPSIVSDEQGALF